MPQQVTARFAALLLLLVFAATCIHACGISTHIEIAHRALHWFNNETYASLINKHPDAFQAGAPFPDWGMGYGDESEEAHWPPFLNAFAKYIQIRYPKPWSDEQEKTVVFLFGMVSHYISDIVWHGLADVHTGFIDSDAALHFHGVFQDAHKVDDPGGDVMTRKENDYDYLSLKWYVPFTDVYNVYQSLGYTNVTIPKLIRCTFELYVGDIAERMMDKLYLFFAKKTAFLVEQFQDYQVGGLDDMAIRTEWEWKELIRSIETSQNFSIVDENEDEYPEKKGLHENKRANYKAKQEFIELVNAKYNPQLKYEGNAVTFSISKPVEQAQYEANVTSVQNSMNAVQWYTMDSQYAYTGYGLAKMQINGSDVLLVGSHGTGERGAPQKGIVQALFKDNILFTRNGKPYSRFGWQVVTLDMNQDGLQDLVISAPMSNLDRHVYWPQGEVHIYYAQYEEGQYAEKPDVVITAATTDTVNMGTTLLAADVNEDGFADLIIGCPNANISRSIEKGMVSIFLSAKHLANGMDIKTADLTIFGEDAWNHFGQSIVVLPKGKIVIGAPSHHSGKTQSVGKVYGYSIVRIGKRLRAMLDWSITGTQPFERLGFSLAYGKPYAMENSLLAVSAPTYSIKELIFDHWQGGAVYLIDIAQLQGDVTIDDAKDAIRARFLSDQAFSRLGFVVGFADFNKDKLDDLYITEPYRDTNAGNDAGAVYVFYGGASFPYGAVYSCSNSATRVHMAQAKWGKFGYNAITGDFDHDGSVELLVAAPRVTIHSRLQGAIFKMQNL